MSTYIVFVFQAVAGNLTALTIGVGIIGAALVSIYVDKTKQFEVVAKLCYAMATLFVIFFVLVSWETYRSLNTSDDRKLLNVAPTRTINKFNESVNTLLCTGFFSSSFWLRRKLVSCEQDSYVVKIKFCHLVCCSLQVCEVQLILLLQGISNTYA